MAPSLRSFRITKNVPLGHNLFLLELEPADSEPMFAFAAGQWVMLYLTNQDGSLAGRAAFSIATAPVESTHEFEIAIKVSGSFTRQLHNLVSGCLVGIHGPFGAFTLKQGSERIVMFAGGIGISPLRSMLRELIAKKDPRTIVLFYSNRTQAETAFEAELRSLAQQHPQFQPIFFVTRETPIDWDGVCRRIDDDACQLYLKNIEDTEFFMCGPRALMNMVAKMLADRGVDVKRKLHKELFQ